MLKRLARKPSTASLIAGDEEQQEGRAASARRRSPRRSRGTSRMRANGNEVGKAQASTAPGMQAAANRPTRIRRAQYSDVRALRIMRFPRYRTRRDSDVRRRDMSRQTGLTYARGRRRYRRRQPHGRADQAAGARDRAAGRGCRDRRLRRPVRPQARRASRIRSWWPPPTASAPRSRSRSRPAGTTRSASTSSPCRSTTSSCRAPSRCSFSTISPAASSIRRSAPRSSRASPRAAGRPAAR